MTMKAYAIPIVLLVIVLNLDRLVLGKCMGDAHGILDTDWVTCVPQADESGKCPHDFIKIASNVDGCAGFKIGKASTPLVCCLLTPVMSVKVKEAPCLTSSTGTPSSQGDPPHGRKSKSQ